MGLLLPYPEMPSIHLDATSTIPRFCFDLIQELTESSIDLYSFLSHADLGSWVGRGSSSWGWTSADGREIVAIGQYDGTAFAEITSEGKLVYLGRLPQYDKIGSQWREIRIVGDIAVIGSEAMSHGVQFFDMKKTLDLDPANPKNFTQDELTDHWDELPCRPYTQHRGQSRVELRHCCWVCWRQ